MGYSHISLNIRLCYRFTQKLIIIMIIHVKARICIILKASYIVLGLRRKYHKGRFDFVRKVHISIDFVRERLK